MNTVCPYCRTAVEPVGENGMSCPSCRTPHHADCFEENAGCTVFGCASAPPEEAKVTLSGSELDPAHIEAERRIEPPVRTPAPPPPLVGRTPDPEPVPMEIPFSGTSTLFGAPPSLRYQRQAEQRARRLDAARAAMARPIEPAIGEAKNRMTFVTLGILLGFFGVHNFYAGYRKKAFTQLLVTLFTLGFASPMTWVWAVVDVCTIDRDERGVRFES